MTEERKCFQLRLVVDGETGIDEVTTLSNVRGYSVSPFNTLATFGPGGKSPTGNQ
jgi:hypothetical protein